MSPLRMGPRATAKKGLSMGPPTSPIPAASSSASSASAEPLVSAESVRVRSAALTSALESGAEALPTRDVKRAQVVIGKAGKRRSIAGGLTVVALVGATGSGKSSLFNNLVGSEVSKVGARRPTTSQVNAAVWGSESASLLLDWLKVEHRHDVDLGPGVAAGLDLDGTVLLDLPDFDSLEASHRREVDRVLELVDVFVWVTDPQKYADARLHEDYIAKFSTDDTMTIVVLNHADRLTMEGLTACRGDLARLLAIDGVLDSEVIPTSAKEGSGVVDLRHSISRAVASRTAAVRRLDSDLRSAATTLRQAVADSEPRLDDHSDLELVDALTRAAGIPVILDAVERDYRRATVARTGWPFTRLLRSMRPAPLKLLRLNSGASALSTGISEADVRSVIGRSSLPPATPAARSAVELAARELAGRASRGLPQRWTDAVTDAATPPGEDLADSLDEAVLGTSLRARNPVWWSAFGVLQWVFVIDVIVGLIWLVVALVLSRMNVAVDVRLVNRVSYPALLLGVSVVAGLLLALLARAIGRVGARRRRVLVAARLREAVAKVAHQRLVAPVQEVLDRHRRTREFLESASDRV